MDIFVQVTIPLLILLALRVKTRKALLMLPFTLFLDADLFFGYHRLLFHNLTVAFVIPLMWVIFIYKYKREWFDYAWIAFFYLFAALLLDIGQSAAIFYPLSTDFHYLSFSVYVHEFIGPIPIPDLNIITGSFAAEETTAISQNLGVKETAARYPTVDEFSTSLMFTLMVAAMMYFKKSWQFIKEVYYLIIDIIKFFIDETKKIMKKIVKVFE